MLLFLDESGTDHKGPPYEVVGGIAVRERDLWNFVQAVSAVEVECFGGHLGEIAPEKEFKAKDILAKDKFRFADQGPPMPAERRAALARKFLERGRAHETPRRDEFTAYGQALLAYVGRLLEVAVHFDLKVFASIVDAAAPTPTDEEALRRDYAFLFERFFYYLEDLSPDERGLIVFDELERSQCRRTIRRMAAYFSRTQKGRDRASRIIPEPFFVHSDLTTGIHTADIVVYVINWAYRFGPMTGTVREELGSYATQVRDMVYRTRRYDEEGKEWPIWSVKYLDDLRPVDERP